MQAIDLLRAGSGNSFTKHLATIHEFYLLGDVETADNYIDWFDTIRHAGENDVIKIYVNSYGGDLFAAIQFMRVIAETNATVVVSVEGACMSAATMIFMCADSVEVTPHSMFMFHNYSGGAFGKGGEMLDQLVHERKWSERLLNEIYEGFMSEEEIEAMLNNKDIWMDGEEVVKRISDKLKLKAEAAEEQVKQLKKQLRTVKSKSKSKPRSKAPAKK